MAVYLVAQGKITDPEKLNQYAQQAGPTVIAAGAKILVADEAPKVIEGETQLPRTVILEFESEDAFRAWYESPEYQAALPLRLESTEGYVVLAQGFEPPA